MARVIAPKVNWLLPVLLLALSAVPIIVGVARLTWLAGGVIRPDSGRFASMPVPLALHILSIVVFGCLGAFMFTPSLRRRWPNWHRAAGRVLAPTGLIAASTGLWMTLYYPPGADDGPALFVLRLVFGSAMAVSLLCGLVAIRRRAFAEHGAWMLRGYAIGMGAGTQVFTTAVWLLLIGPTHEMSRAATMGAGWVINLALAEWILARRLTASKLNPVSSQT
ncbi:DUF2306 domain-containing protein [Caulobacter sp. ErkDOM-YI]|uniref:DUF2306 domain-containing protein n=1 Tax=unclassified Caulobacter TaxID=2648921 RepID=UPI003AF447E7